MSEKNVSITTQSITALLSIIFFLMSYKFNDGSTNAYVGAGYYPMLITGFMALFSITGIFSDLFGKDKDNKNKIGLTNVKNAGYVILAMLIIVMSWQFDLFYPATFVALAILMISLSIKKKTKKSVIVNIITSFIFTASIYVVFDLLLKVKI
jgi:Na+/H+ antiporter NhaD/arsenite permease-like protein